MTQLARNNHAMLRTPWPLYALPLALSLFLASLVFLMILKGQPDIALTLLLSCVSVGMFLCFLYFFTWKITFDVDGPTIHSATVPRRHLSWQSIDHIEHETWSGGRGGRAGRVVFKLNNGEIVKTIAMPAAQIYDLKKELIIRSKQASLNTQTV